MVVAGKFADSMKRNRYGDWKAKCKSKKGRCVSCGKVGVTEYHHIIPLSKGGSNAKINLKELCNACHCRQAGHRHMKRRTK